MENNNGERYRIFRDLNLGELRALEERGKHGYNQFVLDDVCRIIKMDASNAVKGIKNSGLEEHVSNKYISRNSSNRHESFERDVVLGVVEEPALFYLISVGRSQACQYFRIWLYGEVLPALAKHGGYIMPEDRDKYKEDPNQALELIKYNEQLEKYVDKLNARYRRLEIEKNNLKEENERIITNAYNFDQPAAKIDELMHEILNNDLKSYEIIDKLERIRVDMQLVTNSMQRPETL